MNNLRNKVQLIGRLGADPEVKSGAGYGKLAKFNLATDESYKNAKGEKVKETQWHTLIAWGKTADFVEKYLTKGIEVLTGILPKFRLATWSSLAIVKSNIPVIQTASTFLYM